MQAGLQTLGALSTAAPPTTTASTTATATARRATKKRGGAEQKIRPPTSAQVHFPNLNDSTGHNKVWGQKSSSLNHSTDHKKGWAKNSSTLSKFARPEDDDWLKLSKLQDINFKETFGKIMSSAIILYI